MQERLQAFDILRVLATLAVIGIHVSADYASTSGGGMFFNQVVRFSVPMFIIISGFLLYYQELSSSRPEAAVSFYRKRFSKILWPYVIWTVFYTLMTQYLLHTWPDRLVLLAAVGKHLIWGTGAYHLYFMVIIIQCYLLYPLLGVWLHNHYMSFITVLLLLLSLCQVFLYLHTIGRQHLPGTINPQLYLVAFPIWIGYFGLGMYLATIKAWIEARLSYALWPWGVLWAVSLALLLGDSYISGSYASSGKPTIMIYTIMSFLFFYGLALKYNCKEFPLSGWLSRQSFLIYLAHPVVLLFLQRIVHKAGYPAAWQGTTGMLMLYLLTVAISVAAVYLVRNHPWLWLLGGHSSKR